MKPLNSGHLWIFKNVSVINRCPLMGDKLTKIVKFGTTNFVRYSGHVRYLGCPLGGKFLFFFLFFIFFILFYFIYLFIHLFILGGGVFFPCHKTISLEKLCKTLWIDLLF